MGSSLTGAPGSGAAFCVEPSHRLTIGSLKALKLKLQLGVELFALKTAKGLQVGAVSIFKGFQTLPYHRVTHIRASCNAFLKGVTNFNSLPSPPLLPENAFSGFLARKGVFV